MKKNGYRDATIAGTVHTLKALTHKCNLLAPESAKAYLAVSRGNHHIASAGNLINGVVRANAKIGESNAS